MFGISRISTSLSEPWVAWTMLVLLVALGLANKFSPGLIRQSFSSLFSVKERDSLFEQSSSDIRGQICLYIYLLGVMAFMLYLLCFNVSPHPARLCRSSELVSGSPSLISHNIVFSFLRYLELAVLVLVVMLVKMLLTAVLCYVFFDMGVYQMCVTHYMQLLTASLFIAYPLVAVCLFVEQVPYLAIVIMTAVLVLFFYVCLVVKLFRIFFTKILACFYILLYLCTLEWLPLYILAEGAMRITNN